MLNPFQIKKPIGMSYALDETDVLNTKSALSSLGHYKEPDTGMTPWPDTPMFEGLKTFQKDQGLKVDGLMKPGGPTEKALRSSMQPLGMMPGEWDWLEEMAKPKTRPRSVFDDNPAAIPNFTVPIQPISQPISLKGNVNQAHISASTTKMPKGSPNPQRTPRPGETQVAMAPAAAALPWLFGTGAAVITGEFLRRQFEDLMQKNDSALPPLLPTEPEPPMPPSERPDASMKPNREEFPATPPRTPKMRGNPAARPEPTIEEVPQIDEQLKHFGIIVENRRGTGRTPDGVDLTKKALYDELRKTLNQENIGDLGGGRTPDKRWIPEPYFPNNSAKAEGNKRKGSSYADGGFRIIIDDNTNDVLFEHQTTLKDGYTGTALERRKADKLRKNAQGAYVIEVPKQMGEETDKSYEARVRNIVQKNMAEIILRIKDAR